MRGTCILPSPRKIFAARLFSPTTTATCGWVNQTKRRKRMLTAVHEKSGCSIFCYRSVFSNLPAAISALPFISRIRLKSSGINSAISSFFPIVPKTATAEIVYHFPPANGLYKIELPQHQQIWKAIFRE